MASTKPRMTVAIGLSGALSVGALASVALTASPASAVPLCTAETFTALTTSCIVPGTSGTTKLKATVIGGGGGETVEHDQIGGGGAKVTAYLTVAAGSTLSLHVGRGGVGVAANIDDKYNGGAGGGSSAVLTGSTLLIEAGGGGGTSAYRAGGDAGQSDGAGAAGPNSSDCGGGSGASAAGVGGAGGVNIGSCTGVKVGQAGGSQPDGHGGMGGTFATGFLGGGNPGGAGYHNGGTSGKYVNGSQSYGAGGGGGGYGGGGGGAAGTGWGTDPAPGGGGGSYVHTSSSYGTPTFEPVLTAGAPGAGGRGSDGATLDQVSGQTGAISFVNEGNTPSGVTGAVTITAGKVKGKKPNQKVKLSGTTKKTKPLVYVYRAATRNGKATLIGTTRAKSNAWSLANARLGSSGKAFFCARVGSKMSNTIRVTANGSKTVAVRGLRGDYIRCP